MSAIEKLPEKLEDYAFYKSIFPGTAALGLAYDTYRCYHDAAEKGIVANIVLRDLEDENTYYRVLAFSLSGKIPEDILSQLQKIIAECPIDVLTDDATDVAGFTIIAEDETGPEDYRYPLQPFQNVGIYVQVLMAEDPQALNCPYSVYIRDEEGLAFWPLSENDLQREFVPGSASPEEDQQLLAGFEQAMERLDPTALIERIEEVDDTDLSKLAKIVEEVMSQQLSNLNDLYEQHPGLQEMIDENLAAQFKELQEQLALLEKLFKDNLPLMGDWPQLNDEEANYEPEIGLDQLYEDLQTILDLPEQPAIVVDENNSYVDAFSIYLTGITSYLRSYNLDSLAVAENNCVREEILTLLANNWEIRNREQLLETIAHLCEEVDTAKYERYCQTERVKDLISAEMSEGEVTTVYNGFRFVQFFKEKLPAAAMLAWDYGRAAMLIREGYFVDFLSAEEARTALQEIARVMLVNFNSWREFAHSCLFGGLFWSYCLNAEELAIEYYLTAKEAAYTLLTQELPGYGSEWRTNPWIKKLD